MKLNEVLEIAIMYLNLSDELKVTGENRTPLSNRKLKILIRCANVIYGEIASDYMHLLAKDTLVVIDNKVSYQSFNNRVIDIVGVEKNGERVNFTIYPNYLEVDAAGEVDIKYNYLPVDLGLDDEIAYGINLAPTTFASGIAGEYSLVNNLYEEAVAFERKFKEGIRSNLSIKKSKYVKERRWV